MRGGRRALLVALLSSGASALGAGAAHAASVVVLPGVPVAGQSTALEATGFIPRRPVAIRLGSARVTGVKADARGVLSASLRIPAGWPAGSRRLVLSARGRKVSASVRVARKNENPGSALALLANGERFMISSTRARVGARIHIQGSKLRPRRRLTVALGAKALGSARANSHRRLDVAVKVPALSVGPHGLTLRWRGTTLRVRFTVLATPPPPAPPPPPLEAPPPEPPPPPPPPPVVAAAGDIACPAGDARTAVACHQADTAAVIAALAPTAVLPLGDLQYPAGALADFATSYGPTWGRFDAITYPVPGDEEYDTAGAAGYFAYFGARAGDPTRGYYSFNIGDWHIIALNSRCSAVSCDAGQAQERWLRADLAANQRACTLAYWHSPRFTSAGMPAQAVNTGPFWDALYAAGADVVLGGNAHNYERFAPQSPGAVRDDQHGIREFVVGTGGRDHDQFNPPDLRPNSQVREPNTFGVLALTLNPTSYSWRFVPEAGATFTDSGSEPCR